MRWILILAVVIIIIIAFIYFSKRVGVQGTKSSKISSAKIEVQLAQIDYKKAYLKYTNARTKALNCKAARDAKKGGSKKNKACHINKLGILNTKWDEADINKDHKLGILNEKKELLVIAEQDEQEVPGNS